MKTCNKYYEQIINLDELTESEKDKLIKHAQGCDVCQKHLHEISVINGALRQFRTESHVNDELLTRYGIYIAGSKKADYDGKKLTKQEISLVKNHVEHCNECKLKVEQITEDYTEIDMYLRDQMVPNTTLGKRMVIPKITKQISFTIRSAFNSIQEMLFPIQLRTMPTAIMTFATLLIVIWFSPLFRGETDAIYKLAVINKDKIQDITRGASSQIMYDGFTAFNEGDYKSAIVLLEEFIQSDSVATSLAYVHECIGIAYLRESERNFLGRFKGFNVDNVNQGIEHFQKIIDLTDNIRLQENAYWYLGKAYLMINEILLAKKSFDSVIELKGKKIEQAKIILAELNKL